MIALILFSIIVAVNLGGLACLLSSMYHHGCWEKGFKEGAKD